MPPAPGIPALIHQLWIDPSGVEAPAPSDIEGHVARWRELHPGYRHRLWRLAEILALCDERGRPEVAAAIRRCRLPAMQADLARLLLLGWFGGFWCDLKLVPLGPLPAALHRFALVLAEHFPKPDLPDPAGLLWNGFIGAAPGVGLIDMALRLALKNMECGQGDGVFAMTGPGALTTAWRAYRLADPEGAAGARVLAHGECWGVLWGVGADSYNRPGGHWTERQRREPLFDAPPPGRARPPGEGLFETVPGHTSRIDAVHSRRGFHPFEPGPGL